MTVAEALRRAAKLQGISDTARLDTELLLCHVSGLSRTQLYTYPEKSLPPEVQVAFERAFEERLTGKPVAHILGEREFWSLPIKVNASTLIPRPDTEVLVEQAVGLLVDKAAPRILDLGTGTGAIALALAHEFPNAGVTALEADESAVLLAKQNVANLKKVNVTVLLGSWYSDEVLDVLAGRAPFDMVVSNPPYIDEADPHLDRGDVRFEPKSALVAAEHGLADIRAITLLAKQLLGSGGYLLVEHGWQQKENVQLIFAKAGFSNINTVTDYGGNPRVTLGQNA